MKYICDSANSFGMLCRNEILKTTNRTKSLQFRTRMEGECLACARIDWQEMHGIFHVKVERTRGKWLPVSVTAK